MDGMSFYNNGYNEEEHNEKMKNLFPGVKRIYLKTCQICGAKIYKFTSKHSFIKLRKSGYKTQKKWLRNSEKVVTPFFPKTRINKGFKGIFASATYIHILYFYIHRKDT